MFSMVIIDAMRCDEMRCDATRLVWLFSTFATTN